jgi:hypothetical protein
MDSSGNRRYVSRQRQQHHRQAAVDKMKKSLSARSVNTYIEYIQQVVASLKDGETGEPIHRRKWDSSVDGPAACKLKTTTPAVAQGESRRSTREGERRRGAGVVCSGSSDRDANLGALALEGKHFINNGRTIEVQQQVDRDTPRIVSYLKTDATARQIDLCPNVSEYLRTFIDGKNGLLFQTRNGTPYLCNNLEQRWLTPSGDGN